VQAAVDAEHALIVAQQVTVQAGDIDPSAVASALEKLHRHPEPEVAFMRTTHGFLPAYNDGRACAADQRGCRCGLLEWSAGRSLRD
jgi:hypothetical protein